MVIVCLPAWFEPIDKLSSSQCLESRYLDEVNSRNKLIQIKQQCVTNFQTFNFLTMRLSYLI
jgi:hypothetical protein